MNIETANRLLQYRKQHNLSQEELAEKIGVSRQAVSKWERSEASPDTDNLISLAEVYGVSLDELLKGKPEDQTQQETADEKPDEPVEPDNTDTSADDDTNYVRDDRVSFKNGIHVDSKDGDRVRISLKNGVNVCSRDGDNVHVSWDGIKVEEKGKKRVYTDEDGHVMVDEELKNKHFKSPAHKAFLKFPFWAIALALFLGWGFSGMCFGWALSWIAFLSIPLYYSLVDAIFKRDPSHVALPVLCAAVYIFFGYFKVCGGWPFGWIVFLAIPVYYGICSIIKPKKSCDD